MFWEGSSPSCRNIPRKPFESVALLFVVNIGNTPFSRNHMVVAAAHLGIIWQSNLIANYNLNAITISLHLGL